MTNEELVSRIQNGENELLSTLWGQVERLVCWKARSFLLGNNALGGVSFDDLYNSGYLAMVDAVSTYKPIGMAFHSWLIFYLKTAFSEATGYRTERDRNDPLRTALSLSNPLGDDGNNGTLSNLIPDPDAEMLLESVEDKIWGKQLHSTMTTVLQEIPKEQSEVLRMRYYNDQTLEDTAHDLGKTAAEIRTLEIKGIRSLRQPKYANRLRPFYDFNYYYGTGLQHYLNTGTSIQERYLINLEKMSEMQKE